MNYKRTAQELALKLKNNDNCDFVFALCHMRMPHDLKLAAQVSAIDMVFGGHDHFYKVESVCSQTNPNHVVTVVKSGFDFNDFSEITLTFGAEPDRYNDEKKKQGQDKVVSYSFDNRLLCCVERKRVTLDYQPD